MKLEVKKINKKINLDTTPEGCFDKCLEHYWEALSEETSYAGIANCYKIKHTMKGLLFHT